jgi:hypothetical protein
MKKIFLLFICLFLTINFLFSATFKEKVAEEQIQIKNAQDIVEYLERQGIKGVEIKEGILAKIFKIISLRNYKGLYNSEKYSIAIWDFEKSYGYNIAVNLFQMLTLLSDTAVYKERPYIISIEGDKQEQQNIVNKLKIALPNLMEIAGKEY